ncbi:NADP-dependent oxidoreductase [Amorphus orientalis]|uniref:NADPH:quinone reductase-like Zn-dependent oxidoreductase n=1 Tax=Amorphus orientalis TaxID=649198 RepID=A0AAE3VLB8_9HYPH|nr:NADP-dependent oxidoreductase [Amorphus orientalis]MDQ0313855.1 NADPH:quinone reductase-like Zn-dependent oxidoreductase [Amorphus orientalis]
MGDMTAIRFADYGPVDVLSADRVPVPEPGPGEVRIDVKAASVNPIDWKLRKGLLKDVFAIPFPFVTGRDGAGVVAAAGEGVANDLVGRRVCFLAPQGVGTWAETVVLPADLAVPIPDTLSDIDAAALPLAGLSAWIPLMVAAPVERGMRVLIHAGAGGIGSLAVQLMRQRGAHVAATCSARNADFVTSLGADEVVAYDEEAFEDRLSGFDLVFDTMGGDVHARSYDVLKPGGRIVCLNAAPFQDRSAERGVSLVRPVIRPEPDALATLVAEVAAGRITQAIDRVFPFAEFAAAQSLNETGHARGKIVLEIAG